MNTLLLKMGCIFLFGFIFFQSIQGEQPSSINSNHLLSLEHKEFVDYKTTIIASNAINKSYVINKEETIDYLPPFIIQ